MSRTLPNRYVKVTVAGQTSYFTNIKQAADHIGMKSPTLRSRLLKGGYAHGDISASFILKDNPEVAEFVKRRAAETLYVDPVELKAEIGKSQAANACTERLGEMCLLLARKITNMPQFMHYTLHQKEEMIAEAAARLVSYTIFRADTNKNVFAFLTLAVVNAFKTYLLKYYNDKNYRLRYLRDMLGELMTDKDVHPSEGMRQLYTELLNSKFLNN